jgi:hypothetical protein
LGFSGGLGKENWEQHSLSLRAFITAVGRPVNAKPGNLRRIPYSVNRSDNHRPLHTRCLSTVPGLPVRTVLAAKALIDTDEVQ